MLQVCYKRCYQIERSLQVLRCIIGLVLQGCYKGVTGVSQVCSSMLPNVQVAPSVAVHDRLSVGEGVERRLAIVSTHP
jgi:hypothetical protein